MVSFLTVQLKVTLLSEVELQVRETVQEFFSASQEESKVTAGSLVIGSNEAFGRKREREELNLIK